jgi:hypothetical protein
MKDHYPIEEHLFDELDPYAYASFPQNSDSCVAKTKDWEVDGEWIHNSKGRMQRTQAVLENKNNFATACLVEIMCVPFWRRMPLSMFA